MDRISQLGLSLAFCCFTPTLVAMEGEYRFAQIGIELGAQREVLSSGASLGTLVFVGDRKVRVGGREFPYLERPDGTVILPDPASPDTSINAQLGEGAHHLIGATTGASGTYRILTAMRGAVGTPVLSGTYRALSFRLTGGATPAAAGELVEVPASALSVDLREGGGGSLTHPVLGLHDVWVSGTGDVILGVRSGTPPSLLVAVRASGGEPAGLHWLAEFGVRPEGIAVGAGSLQPFGKQAKVYQGVNSQQAVANYRAVNSWIWSSDGTGRMDSARLAKGGSGLLLGISTEGGSAAMMLALPAPTFAADGVFLHPHGIFDAASHSPHGNPLAPGSLATVYGSDLADGNAASVSLPLPLELNGVAVDVNGVPAPLLFVSRSQINIQVPESVAGREVQVRIRNRGAMSAPAWAPMAATSPAIFTPDGIGVGMAIATHPNWRPVTGADPARRGDMIVLFGTGFGTGPQRPTVRFGGIATEILYAGPVAGFAGLDQVNVRVPPDSPIGDAVPVTIVTIEGATDLVDLPVTP